MTADTIVVVVGYTPGDEGEEYAIQGGGDRSTLDLPAGQNDFVTSILDLGKPTVIIIESGSIVNLPWLAHTNKNQATIWAGYPGLRGGAALGKLIFGKANFSGKMPMAWPAQTDLPAFTDGADALETHMGYFFGYREYDRRKYVDGTPVNLIFPFGHGLSYSTFEYSNLVLPACPSVGKDGIIDITVDVKNTSMVDGEEVVMLFVKPPPKPANVTGNRPWKELKSFAKVAVPAQQTVQAHLPLRMRDLRRWEGDTTGHWMVDSGEYTLLVGKDAEDAEVTMVKSPLQVVGD
jgi:beta-glucosidase